MQRFIILICFVFCGQLNAQIITDRPDQTESSSTVGIGNLQIETGVLLSFDEEDSISTRQILAPTTLFRYGITGGIELRILSQFESNKLNEETFQGISDLEIGTKFQILNKKNINTEIAFLSHILVPTGTSELSSDEVGSVNKLCVSHAFSEKLGLGYNMGYNYFGDNNGDFTWSMALGIAVNDKVGCYIEPYGEIANLEESIVNFDAGFTYLANENLQFDFSFGTSLTETSNYIGIGGSWLLMNE